MPRAGEGLLGSDASNSDQAWTQGWSTERRRCPYMHVVPETQRGLRLSDQDGENRRDKIEDERTSFRFSRFGHWSI